MTREPAVAGQFYPGHPQELRRSVLELLRSEEAPRAATGVIVPHAGYVYSGGVAGATFARVRIPENVVILGPNHHGLGEAAALFSVGGWRTPLGEVPVADDLAGALLEQVPGLAADELAHRFEHSLEVQLPFLQLRAPRLRIVPICLGQHSLPQLLAMGEGLARVLGGWGSEVLLVASSDMTHYEPGPVAREKDMRALERVLALDPEGLYRTVLQGRISMCGVLPTVVMLEAARMLGCRRAELVRYANSGEVTGDQGEVVGYAGVALWKDAVS